MQSGRGFVEQPGQVIGSTARRLPRGPCQQWSHDRHNQWTISQSATRASGAAPHCGHTRGSCPARIGLVSGKISIAHPPIRFAVIVGRVAKAWQGQKSPSGLTRASACWSRGDAGRVGDDQRRSRPRVRPRESGPNYLAHITVGYAKLDDLRTIEAEPFDTFAVHPIRIAVFHLANNGTARKQLKVWTLTR